MTMKATMPIASRRTFVGLGAAFLRPPSHHRHHRQHQPETARHQDRQRLLRPRIFAVGDVRGGNFKRVASAVGEGSIAVTFVHQVLHQS